MAKKNVLKKYFKHNVTINRLLDVEYYVEAKQGGKWVVVAGPFTESGSADTFAKEYSKTHPGVEVQVVVYQSN